jgi:hypothetical protein
MALRRDSTPEKVLRVSPKSTTLTLGSAAVTLACSDVLRSGGILRAAKIVWGARPMTV